jgi:hypothetical protein
MQSHPKTPAFLRKVTVKSGFWGELVFITAIYPKSAIVGKQKPEIKRAAEQCPPPFSNLW